MEELGKFVWLQEEDEHGWVPVKITEIKDDTFKLTATINEELIEWEVDRKDFKIMDVHPSCLEGTDDLLMLGDFNEPTLLQNTRARYYQDRIYSFIGTPILIAVNPYKRLITDEKLLIAQIKEYFKKMKSEGSNNTLPPSPHLYFTGEVCYQDMILDKRNQSIIISGESGSGKTESTKIILKYLATVSSDINDSNANKGPETESVEKQVLDSNPLLEAFGNAKTVKNNNSSRFGKFIQVNFTEFGKIISAKIFNYLLEKSRVVKIQPEERNYHIFYQFLYGSNEQEKAKYCLKDPDYYKYLKYGCFKIEDEDDAKNFLETKDCMTKLKFNEEEKKLIFSLLSGILYLGNIEYEEVQQNGKNTLCITEESKSDFKLAAEFLGLESEKLNKILTIKKYTDPLTKNVLERFVPIDAAHNSRDAISKAIYAKMFDWIIKKINLAIANTEKEKLIKDKDKILKIGILDIFGFEIFEVNSFEQLCINYANERLQQFFNNSLFKLEQDEYVKEKIDWSKINFKDNKDIIELIDNNSKSIFSLLDSEAILKNTDDKKFRDNVYNHLTGNPHLVSYKGGYGDTIVIHHYAGQVEYLVYSFIEKNNDQLNNDIGEAFENSKNKLIKHLFKKKEDVGAANKKKAPNPKEKDGPNRIQTDSLSKQFKKQLDELLKMLSASNPRYVKCIKPNSIKKPRIFESLDVNRQLLSAGVLESIKIRKQGYSIRRTKEEFVRRYIPLTPNINLKNYPASPNRYDLICADIFKTLSTHPDFKDTFDDKKKIIQIGLSKIFMKDEVKSFLEFKLNNAVKKYIIKIQAFAKKILGVKKMKKRRLFSLKIQKRFRGFILRKRWKKLKNIFKFQILAHNFFSKLIRFHFKKQAKEFHQMKLEEKRKREEAELKRLEEENKKRMEEKKKLMEEQKKSEDEQKKELDEYRQKLQEENRKKQDDQIKFNTDMEHNKRIEKQDAQIKNPKGKKTDFPSISNKESYGDMSTSDIQLLNDLQGVKSTSKKKPKKSIFNELLPKNNNPVLEDMLKEQIEKLEAELNQIKSEKEKLTNELDQTKEVNSKKEKEIESLKTKLNTSSATITDNPDKLNSDFQSEMEKKKNQLLNKSDNNSNLSIELRNCEDDVRKLKKELNEKESTVDILNLKINELTKNNKSLNDLNDNLKYQINKGNERLNTEMKHYYDHMHEIELQKTDLERKVRDLENKNCSSNNLPILNISVDKSGNADKDNSLLSKSKLSEMKKENKILTKKMEDYKSKFEKEINTLKNSITVKDNRIKELENKQKMIEDEMKLKNEQFDLINNEYEQSKDKIMELKNKIETLTNQAAKLREYENEVEKIKNELVISNRKKDTEIKDLKDSLDKYMNMNEKLKKVDLVLKEELNNKESELSKRQELITYYQDEYDKISDENMRIKKENLTYKGKLEILEVDYKNKFESEIKMKSSEILGLKEKSKTYEKLVNELKEILKKKQRIIDFKKQINLMLVELLKLKRTEVQYLEAHKYTNSSNLKENINKIKENEQDLLNKMNEMTNNPDYTDSEAEEEEEENEEDSFECSNDFQN